MEKCNYEENGFCKSEKKYITPIYCKFQCQQKNNKTPDKIKMAKSFSKAAIKHIASGLKTREQKEIRRIMSICRNCDEYVNKRCKICGCNMNKKIEWATTHCPLKKWEGD